MTADGELFVDPRFQPRAFTLAGEPMAWHRAGERIVGVDPKKRFIQHFDPPEQANHKLALVAMARTQAQIREPFDGACGLDVVASWLFPRAWSETRIRSTLTRMRAEPEFMAPKSTRPDADNVAKLCLDALNGVAYRDDGQVWLVRSIKCWGPRSETHVRIWYGDRAPLFPFRWWSL